MCSLSQSIINTLKTKMSIFYYSNVHHQVSCYKSNISDIVYCDIIIIVDQIPSQYRIVSYPYHPTPKLFFLNKTKGNVWCPADPSRCLHSQCWQLGALHHRQRPHPSSLSWASRPCSGRSLCVRPRGTESFGRRPHLIQQKALERKLTEPLRPCS